VQSFEFSVFEVNIRFIGGMLACYALTGDTVMTFRFVYAVTWCVCYFSLFWFCIFANLMVVS